MKKLLAALVLILIVAVAAVFVFIPTRQTIGAQVNINCTQPAAERILLDKRKLPVWWPGTISSGNVLLYKEFRYVPGTFQLNGILASITNGTDEISGMLQLVPTKDNTISLKWTSPVQFSNNPLTRVKQYYNFVAYKKNLDSLFSDIKNRLEKEENVYGFTVARQTVTDTLLVSVKHTFRSYPGTTEVYGMVNELMNFIRLNKGVENGYPMLNVHPLDSTNFEVMVAMPTKTAIQSANPFMFKKMIPGNILVAEVRGGSYTVMQAEEQLTNYANDHKKLSPAIPYQSLITDRQRQPDTTKWITRLYYPIFI